MIRLLPLFVIAFAIGGCVNREAQKQAQRTQELIKDITQPVRVEPSRAETIKRTVEITGSITTWEDTQVGAKVGGRLVAVYVKDGDRVSAGQTIAQQETSDAMARVRQAQAEVDRNRAVLDQALQDQRVGPERSNASVRAAEAQVAQMRANLQKVRKGARDEERTIAQWAVDSAKNSMETLRKERDRKRALEAEGAISKKELEQAENAYFSALTAYEKALQDQQMIQKGARPEDLELAKQQLAAADEALRQAKASQKLDAQYGMRVDAARAALRAAQEQLSLARQGVSDTSIKSPFSGTISGKPAQVGTFVGPGTVVARVIGGGGVYFEGDVPESKLEMMSTGLPVWVTVSAFQNETFSGSIVAVNPLGADVGRVFRVRVQISGDTGKLRPGMFAKGQVETGSIPDATTVPSTAIIKDGKEFVVYVFDKGKAKRVVVEPGAVSGDRTQVKGLNPGESVIIKGQSKLANGSAIKLETPEAQKSDTAAPEGKQ